jgi:GNAT superfamily N-acetyltransferase
VVALVDGKVAAYLIGSVRENEWWRRRVRVGLAGHAAREPELVRDLYRFLAERWAVIGHLLLEPEAADLARPPGSIYLAVAATLPEARGTGAGVALTERALEWAKEAGYETV